MMEDVLQRFYFENVRFEKQELEVLVSLQL